MVLRSLLLLASPPTASPAEDLIGIVVIVVGALTLATTVRLWKRKTLARPSTVQAAEITGYFDGRDQVKIYPTMTALPREQICWIAQQRGYVLQSERTEGIRHPYRVIYFQRVLPADPPA